VRPKKEGRVEFRLDPEFKEQLEKDAEENGMSLSQFLRWVYLDWKKRQKK